MINVDKTQRNMIIEYDNIIQSIDYGFYEYIRNTEYLKLNGLLSLMNIDEIIFTIINRPVKDILCFLTQDKISLDNCSEFNIDKFQRNSNYFIDPIISEFSSNINLLLLTKSVDKLFISVDVKNKEKIKILESIFFEYLDLINIVDINYLDEYIQKDDINTVVANEDTVIRNIDFLKNKSIMIPQFAYMFTREELDGEMYQISKYHWEEKNDLDVVFFEPYRFKEKRKILFK